jgi:hypothetical protein
MSSGLTSSAGGSGAALAYFRQSDPLHDSLGIGAGQRPLAELGDVIGAVHWACYLEHVVWLYDMLTAQSETSAAKPDLRRWGSG